PHDIRGNIVKAFVILQDHTAGDDTLVKELQQFVKNEVAPYKYGATSFLTNCCSSLTNVSSPAVWSCKITNALTIFPRIS
ncbi:hypothetical protein IDG70_05135, partial [Staphylococcus sp. EG-SA-26]|nr:hypothetical protein [Staphylococcus sp. EG-SA-26]